MRVEDVKFSHLADEALNLAEKVARRFQINWIRTEHLFIGLLELGGSSAAAIIKKAGIKPSVVKRALESKMEKGTQPSIKDMPQTPRLKKVLHYAKRHAYLNEISTAGTGELLAGILKEGDSIAASVLKEAGLKLEFVEYQMKRKQPSNWALEVAVAEVNNIPARDKAKLRQFLCDCDGHLKFRGATALATLLKCLAEDPCWELTYRREGLGQTQPNEGPAK